MNNALVSNWNKVVAPNDIVFHLGDFCFGDRKTWKSFVAN
jgi:calcineurin-like phosphoesterase family protein|nr:MAG TPA: metallophosphatase domain protein [Caudoviricetes sp.]